MNFRSAHPIKQAVHHSSISSDGLFHQDHISDLQYCTSLCCPANLILISLPCFHIWRKTAKSPMLIPPSVTLSLPLIDSMTPFFLHLLWLSYDPLTFSPIKQSDRPHSFQLFSKSLFCTSFCPGRSEDTIWTMFVTYIYHEHYLIF